MLDKLIKIFIELFGLERDEINHDLSYHNYDQWDSLKHLNLVQRLEDVFDIEIEMDDIIAMESFGVIIKILNKYGVEI